MRQLGWVAACAGMTLTRLTLSLSKGERPGCCGARKLRPGLKRAVPEPMVA